MATPFPGLIKLKEFSYEYTEVWFLQCKFLFALQTPEPSTRVKYHNYLLALPDKFLDGLITSSTLPLSTDPHCLERLKVAIMNYVQRQHLQQRVLGPGVRHGEQGGRSGQGHCGLRR